MQVTKAGVLCVIRRERKIQMSNVNNVFNYVIRYSPYEKKMFAKQVIAKRSCMYKVAII